MKFKVIDLTTGKEPTSRAIHDIAQKGGLMEMDIDQFFVGEDGTIVLADDCGRITYVDMDRFIVEVDEIERKCYNCNAISREHLLNEIALLKKSPWYNNDTDAARLIRKDAVEMIEDLCIKREPPIYPEPKMGHNCNEDYADCDQFVCSECGIELQDWRQVERDEDNGDITFNEYVMRFCPNCGVKIVF